jgi:conjugal transfer/entry exclusion protein
LLCCLRNGFTDLIPQSGKLIDACDALQGLRNKVAAIDACYSESMGRSVRARVKMSHVSP